VSTAALRTAPGLDRDEPVFGAHGIARAERAGLAAGAKRAHLRIGSGGTADVVSKCGSHDGAASRRSRDDRFGDGRRVDRILRVEHELSELPYLSLHCYSRYVSAAHGRCSRSSARSDECSSPLDGACFSPMGSLPRLGAWPNAYAGSDTPARRRARSAWAFARRSAALPAGDGMAWAVLLHRNERHPLDLLLLLIIVLIILSVAGGALVNPLVLLLLLVVLVLFLGPYRGRRGRL
jgi:hypothetical protein